MPIRLPDTRLSLIARLPDGSDAEAWADFLELYHPLVFRLARSKGFQDADAHEISQEVMLAVSRSVDRWEPDPRKGRFRDWLFRIAHNTIIDFLTRRKHQSISTGDSHVVRLLNQQAKEADETHLLQLEYRREMFRLAAERVRDQVRAATWQAFWMSKIEGKETELVAGELGMTVGAVHIACSRVRSRLQVEIQRLESSLGVDR